MFELTPDIGPLKHRPLVVLCPSTVAWATKILSNGCLWSDGKLSIATTCWLCDGSLIITIVEQTTTQQSNINLEGSSDERVLDRDFPQTCCTKKYLVLRIL